MEFNNILSISAVINGFTALILGLVVFRNAQRNIVNNIFLLFTLAISVWSLGYYFWLQSENQNEAMFWIGVVNLGSIFIPITYYHWVTLILKNKRKIVIYVGYIVSIIFALFSFTNFYVSGFVSVNEFQYWPIAGPLYIYFILILYFGFLYWLLWMLFMQLQKKIIKLRKLQL
jgi:hypothetical protein